MSAAGNYFVPKTGEALTSGSTVGTWWLSALALKIFGWGEFSVRFWSALSGLGMVLASVLASGTGSERRAWLSGSICAGMTACFVVSQLASSHALYSCLTGLAMAGIIRAGENKRWLILAHGASALAFIVHGPSGLFLVWLSVWAYSAVCDDIDTIRDFFTWPAGIIITLIFSGLYFVALMVINPQIIHFMRCQHHTYTFGGITGTLVFVFMSLVPYHGFIIRAVWESVPRKFPANKSPELFMLLWAGIFGFSAVLSGDVLAVSSSVPALSAMLGYKLDVWLSQKKLIPVRISVMLNITILIPVLYMILPFAMNYLPLIRASLLSLIPWGLLTGLFIFACWYYTKTRQIEKWVRNVPAAAMLCLMPLAGVFNLAADVYSVRDIGLKLRDTIEGTDTVIQYGVNYPSIYFYTYWNSRLINAPSNLGIEERRFLASDSELHELWPKKERVFLIIPAGYKPETPLPKDIFHLLEAEGMLLLSNR